MYMDKYDDNSNICLNGPIFLTTKQNKMNNTLIHIKAVSPYFEVYEIIPENKAVMRLRKIRR